MQLFSISGACLGVQSISWGLFELHFSLALLGFCGLKFRSYKAVGVAMSKVFSDLVGVSDIWDDVKVVRNRVSNVGALVVAAPAPGTNEEVPSGIVLRTVENAKHNFEVIKPVFEKMKDHFDKVPEIGILTNEVIRVMAMHNKKITHKQASDQAWGIRYLFGVVKHMMYKPVPPRDS